MYNKQDFHLFTPQGTFSTSLYRHILCSSSTRGYPLLFVEFISNEWIVGILFCLLQV